MKPRREVLPTPDDTEVWGMVSPGVMGDWRSRLYWLAHASDRRDADLMLNIMHEPPGSRRSAQAWGMIGIFLYLPSAADLAPL